MMASLPCLLTPRPAPIFVQTLTDKTDEAPERVPETPQRPQKVVRSLSLPNLPTIPERQQSTLCPSEDVLARVMLECAKLSQRFDALRGEMSERVDELTRIVLTRINLIEQRVDGLDSIISLQIHDSINFRREIEAQMAEARQREDAELQRMADALHEALRSLWKLYSADFAALKNSLCVMHPDQSRPIVPRLFAVETTRHTVPASRESKQKSLRPDTSWRTHDLSVDVAIPPEDIHAGERHKSIVGVPGCTHEYERPGTS